MRLTTLIMLTITAALALGTSACTEPDTGQKGQAVETTWDFFTEADIDLRALESGCPKADPFCTGVVPAAREAYKLIGENCSSTNSNGTCIEYDDGAGTVISEPLWIQCVSDSSMCACALYVGHPFDPNGGIYIDVGCNGTGHWDESTRGAHHWCPPHHSCGCSGSGDEC